MKPAGRKAYAHTMNLAREPRFRLGAIEVRPATREFVHPGGRESLEPRVMSVLVHLVQAKGKVITRDDLSAACWDGRIVSDDAINRVISRIRKLSDLTEGRDFTLETITKVGYRLVIPGSPEAAVPTAKPQGAAVSADGVQVEAVLPAKKDSAFDLVRRFWLAGAAAIVAGLLGASLFASMTRPQTLAPDPSGPLTIAVLPFDDLGGADGDAILANGLAREIRNTLSRVRGLRVVSDSSSFAVASESLTATDMGRRLGADLLLDGSLIRDGESVRLTVELVDGREGVNVWTGGESGPASDMENLRQSVSADVVEQLVLKLGPNRVSAASTPPRSDPKIYAMVVQASELLDQFSLHRMRGDSEQALRLGDAANTLIEQVLAIDPLSPHALGMKGRLVSSSATTELSRRGRPDAEKAAEASGYARRALSFEPDFVPALGFLGEYYRRYEWRWTEARTLLERALALDPNNSPVHLSYAYYLSGSGRCVESLKHARIAIEIDPEFGWRTLGVPRALKCLGRFEESDAAYLAAIGQDPGNLFILREIYLNHLVRRDADGLAKLRAHVGNVVWKGAPSTEVQGWLHWTGLAEAALRGDRAPFVVAIEREVLANFGPAALDGPIDIHRGKGDVMWIQAVEFAIAGEPERAVDMLEGSLKSGALYIPETMPYGAFEFTPEVRVNPRYQSIWRTDPRLVELAALRLQALRDGQMHGVLPDGRVVTPAAE